MSDKIRIKTNNVPRFILDASELTLAEQKDFDYLDWPALEAGTDSASFLRYKGQVYDLSEFNTTRGLPEFNPLTAWDGYLSDSFFSGIVIRYADSDCESVIVGTFFA